MDDADFRHQLRALKSRSVIRSGCVPQTGQRQMMRRRRNTLGAAASAAVIARAAAALASGIVLGGCGLMGGPSGPSPATSPLLDPTSAEMTTQAPDTFKVLFETTEGDVVIQVYREWAPLGADRFYNLVRHGYYNHVRFFRNIAGFMAQFGIHGDPQVSNVWRMARFPDDSVRTSNVRGTISFASAGPNTRTVQVFINHADNTRLDPLGFAPFGRVTGGMDVVDNLYSGYGEGAPQGEGPLQDRIQAEGNEYLQAEFPLLDFIISARLIPD
jgi:peptidyl-prolyl cis-trans isomerase A (cyclophilin A)